MKKYSEIPFHNRHIGPNEENTFNMLSFLGYNHIDQLIDDVVPSQVKEQRTIQLPEAMSEVAYLEYIDAVGNQNQLFKSYIGQGYYGTYVPSVIRRNLFENPGWYTQYTPYQAEIAQGRLESLLNFQTMVSDLTALPISNASLLDEATAAAEAMTMFYNMANKSNSKEIRSRLFIDNQIYPQTLSVLKNRAEPIGVELVIGDYKTFNIDSSFFGALVQYPNNIGSIEDYSDFIKEVHNNGAYIGFATDLLALTLLKAPGELGADAAFGNTQRFGVPMGFGGPHAAFFATTEEFKRLIPGRVVGVSVDTRGKRALRLALQTREQHIKREKATSNICTAQALLANMAAMYAVYHGSEGILNISRKIHQLTLTLYFSLKNAGITICNQNFFDTIVIETDNIEIIRENAERENINLRYISSTFIGVSLDETTQQKDVEALIRLISCQSDIIPEEPSEVSTIPHYLQRTSTFLQQPVFNSYHSETKMMRYLKVLENRDLSLNTSMISLGSCTMKLNAASELIPLGNEKWANMHPFAPESQTKGYQIIIKELESHLREITGMAACTIHPNSGAQGEFAGLLCIRKYHQSIGEGHRNIMLIPLSAHGTNPASAVMVGYKVIPIKTLENGNIDLMDLQEKANKNSQNLGGVMLTYPSTFGIYEETVIDVTRIIHENGGQVYLDGANLNAQIGITSPSHIGVDVCHLNLHKTFSIPHGGGGPGVGPICVQEHLIPFLPSQKNDEKQLKYPVSATEYGSAYILSISFGYIRMMGSLGLKKATQTAILNANYMKARLEKDYNILYSGQNNTCAHEFIIDLRPFKKIDIEAEDVAKRLMDFNFHPPTLSFPVPGTLMIEPTESEDKDELDRFCDAMLFIRDELSKIENGDYTTNDNPINNAPHTQEDIIDKDWNRSYTREEAAYALPYIFENKFWPSTNRVNNSLGDRNLICTCDPVEAYIES